MTRQPARAPLAALVSTALVAFSVTAAVPAVADDDTTGPQITVKTESDGVEGRYRSASFKLHDADKVDKVELNGVTKDLSNSTWSDLNKVKPGTFGAVEGTNTLVAFDVLGNTSSLEFVLDTTGPEVTVKPESDGVDGRYRSVSFKLHDASKVAGLTLNGVEKDLTDNVWSDLNKVKPGTFGAVEGDNTLVVRDLLGNETTLEFVLDTTGPEVTVKPESKGADGRYRSVSFKLHDGSKVAGLTLNGVEKDLTDNVWSDLNGVKPGTFGAVEGDNTLVVLDALGNETTLEFVLDTDGPDVTVKPESDGADGRYRSLSVKLHDASKVDKVEINGVTKDLTNNVWSDVNGIKPGTFGAVEGDNTLVAHDVLGNTTALEFVLDTIGPSVSTKEDTMGGDGHYRSVSFKLHDDSKVDGLTLNGVEKDLTNDVWSDLNGVKPGVFGAVEGTNTLVVRDALGNTTTVEFVLDTARPVVEIESPVAGSASEAANAGEVTFTATDGTALRRVAANLYQHVVGENGETTAVFYRAIGSTSADSAIGEASWTGGWALPTDLPAGTYTVRVGAHDLAGNWGGANVDIVIEESDATEPGEGEGDGDGNTETGDGNTETGDGNTETGNTETGDGDGDGEGDGNTETGDGDGDGEGDGNTETGDGDGDGNTETGDGNTETGDGDTEGDGDSNTETEQPSLEDSFVTSVSVDGVPWIVYDVVLTDPAGLATNDTVRLVLTDGDNAIEAELGTLDEDGRLSGATLWPGAEIAEDGTPTAFPGWTDENGTWERVEDEYSWTLGDITAILEVNPEIEFDLAYPEGAGPQVTDGVEELAPVETDDDTTAGAAVDSNVVAAAATSEVPAATAVVATAAGEELATTGSSTMWLALGAALLVAAGAGVMILRRRNA